MKVALNGSVSTAESRPRCLYLAMFDPTGSTSGTSTRGRLFLRRLSERFETHVVYMREKEVAGVDRALMRSLAGIHAVDFSTLGYFLFSPSFWRRARQVFESLRFDVIFADFEKAGLYALGLTRIRKVPWVYSSHNVEYRRYMDFGKTDWKRYLFVPYLYLVERLCCRSATMTVSISESDARSFRHWVAADRVSVLPCAFDEQALNPHYPWRPSDPPIVLLVGNYRNAGNRQAALHVFRYVVEPVVREVPDVVFRFVGGGLPQEIRHPNIQVAGYVEDLFEEYRHASVTIAPIEVGAGVKIKVVEGLATGIHTIATPKAMEGIESAGLENLEVVELSGFPRAIVRALTGRPVKTDRNWAFVASRFGCGSAMTTLVERMLEMIG